MNISREELQALIGLLGVTELEELNCEQFLSLTPGYLEKLRVYKAGEIEGYRGFLHHLGICPECQEEFEALCAAMRDGTL